MLTENQYEERKDTLEGLSIGNLWKNIHPEGVSGEITLNFDEEKTIFLWFLRRLMEDGKIRLASRGVFLPGTIEEQMNHFEKTFPKNQEQMDDGAFDGFWFLTEKCPGGIVWIHENGYLDWT
ncbi:DUF596 domain-containing protein [Serratia fonticola]|uniref:DUF596 domain-containing protein n=1 Tax=Serratia fonticola TaxID=47917 RepID=A0AAW3WXL9_SERFO|nr:DUF596 domain-containing protein [Serratia fonticola]MBC3215160.1 DUF596 domain-containing protein [Serratia fonticola]NYA15711.1 DUF596 domain-containing protein [Serratia fonticola]NYA35831.1 DUF596 domain-containing protein [Serratia fonticola]